MAGVLHFRDPSSGNWVPLTTASPAGGVGPQGPPGPDGLYVGPAQPTAPEVELWVDTVSIASDERMLTVSESPASGTGTGYGHVWLQF